MDGDGVVFGLKLFRLIMIIFAYILVFGKVFSFGKNDRCHVRCEGKYTERGKRINFVENYF